MTDKRLVVKLREYTTYIVRTTDGHEFVGYYEGLDEKGRLVFDPGVLGTIHLPEQKLAEVRLFA